MQLTVEALFVITIDVQQAQQQAMVVHIVAADDDHGNYDAIEVQHHRKCNVISTFLENHRQRIGHTMNLQNNHPHLGIQFISTKDYFKFHCKFYAIWQTTK